MRLLWTCWCCWAGSDTNIMSKGILNLKPLKRFLQDYEQTPSRGQIPLDDLTLAPKIIQFVFIDTAMQYPTSLIPFQSVYGRDCNQKSK